MPPSADTARYKNHRCPGDIMSHGVWLSYRFPLSYREVQELLFECGIAVSHEAVRQRSAGPGIQRGFGTGPCARWRAGWTH